MSNKGYIFQNYFDAFCYLVISALYPMLTFFNQSTQIIKEPMMEINFLITAFFFAVTFFYDYYQRFRDCDKQTAFVVNILCIGNFSFAVLAGLMFLFIVCIAGDFFSQFKDEMLIFANNVWISALYPFVMAIREILKRLSNQRKRKICRAVV